MPSNMPDARAVNEALRRAREMQNRSAPLPRPETPPEPEPPAEIPPDIPETPAQPLPAAQKSVSPLDILFKDRERTLILALLILLSGEGDRTDLLFALMYLLI